jgi:Flp pilus assembly CpaE family ATPase
MLRQMSSFVIVDMPYTFDPHYFETLAAADRVLLVARQDVPAIQAAKLIKQTLLERGVIAPGLVLNQYHPKRTAFSCEAIGKLLQIEQVFPIAADSLGHQTAVNAGRPLREVVPNSVAVADVRAIATSILEAAGIHPHLPRVSFRDRLRTLLTRMQT